MTADEILQLLWHRKRYYKIITAKAAVLLPFEPLPGFLILAVGAMPIAAAAVHMVVSTAGAVLINRETAKAAVPQILLNAADIDPGFQQMSGVVVVYGMNRDPLFELGLFERAG